MKHKQLKRTFSWLVCLTVTALFIYLFINWHTVTSTTKELDQLVATNPGSALAKLAELPVKEKESGEDYERSLFSSSWASWRDCNVRQKILNRDLTNITLADNDCTVTSGTLIDPYSGKTLELTTKSAVSSKVQIDHVVALSNAWQTGAKYLTKEERKALANDDLELIAVSSKDNQEKSDGDASEWLPENKSFQCPYVARQIAVKLKYRLWITPTEKSAMTEVLLTCPSEPLPAE